MTPTKLKVKLWAALVTLGIVSLFGLGSLAQADSQFSWANVEHDVAELIFKSSGQIKSAVPIKPAQNLGGTTAGRFGSEDCVGNDCTFHLAATSISGSSTIFSIVDPFQTVTSSAGDVVIGNIVNGLGNTGATSTVELGRINVTTAATSTYSVLCATAPNPYATSSLSQAFIETGTSVTGTPQIESGFYNPPDGRSASLTAPWYPTASTTFAKVLLTPATPYLICKVNAATANAFAGNPTFAAQALFRISKNQGF